MPSLSFLICLAVLLITCLGEGRVQSNAKVLDVHGNIENSCISDLQNQPSYVVKDMWKLLEFFELPSRMETTTTEEDIDFGACNIERVSLRYDRTRAEEILRERIDVQYQDKDLPPIILTDLRDADLQHELIKSWGTVDSLLERFGTHPVYVGPAVKLPAVSKATFQDYVNFSRSHRVDLTVPSSALDFDYQFKKSNLVPPSDWRLSTISLTDKGLEDYLEPPVFAYQPKLLGLPFHAHKAAVNEIISGSKYWLFYPRRWGCDEDLLHDVLRRSNWTMASFLPPFINSEGRNTPTERSDSLSCDSIARYVANEFVNVSQKGYSDLTKACRAAASPSEACAALARERQDLRLSARWLTEVLPTLEPDNQPTHRCATYAGEAMLVPDYYWHSTINLEDSIIFIRGNSQDKAHDSSIPMCTKDFGGGKTLLELWNPTEHGLDVFWRNTTSGESQHTRHIPSGASEELRTFSGLKFSVWYREHLRASFEAGKKLKTALVVHNSRLTDFTTWDSCNFIMK